MTNLPKKEEIREAIAKYATAKGLSQNELATHIGTSTATLSKIKNGKWDDIAEELWRKIWNRVREATAPGTFQTRDFTVCRKVCEAAQQNHLMIGLLGDTGTG